MAKDVWFFIAFFGILISLGFATRDGGLFEGIGSATSTHAGVGSTTLSTYPSSGATSTTENARPLPPPLTPNEVEEKIARIYRELDTLTEELRVAKLHEPVSPYAGRVSMSIGNARDTNPDTEYIFIRANTSNTSTINISNWYLKSYVTDERAALPQGDRVIERWRSPKGADIFLEPGEDAYVMTTESPLNASFRENMCTGYIATERSFYPSLTRNCPRPLDEMKRFAQIRLDDDSCYDFIQPLSSCVTPTDEALDDADLTNACRRLIDTTLNYDSCVVRHQHDPFFDNPGTWHIYLERDEDLWRKEREIIRLMDENDRIIDVIEY